MYVCVCVCVYINIYIYVCDIYVCNVQGVYICVQCTGVCVHMYEYMYSVHICIYYIYVYMYIHIHTHVCAMYRVCMYPPPHACILLLICM